ncbi:MAG: lamin tail domain-containing protein [candidate division WOR-3 bacterium]|nr:lamin tail domain-containing protein [candidate division WOR-3 bacterium]
MVGLIIIELFLFNLTSPLIINEVMANPKGISGANNPEDRNEFVELYNISVEPVNIKNFRITDFDATDIIIPWTDSTIFVKYPNVVIGESIIPPSAYAIILDQEYTSQNASGGEIQPYSFPDSLIILTVGNTTIGDELATNDPVLIYSLQGDSSSFGTPFQDDGFPSIDYGSTYDGRSWERISVWAEDTIGNWFRSIDSSGATPGYENSVTSYYDLAINSITISPQSVTPNSQATVAMTLANIGYQPAYYWNLVVFDDQNNNGTEDINERLFFQSGFPFLANQESIICFIWDSIPVGQHTIWAVVNFPDDRNLNNNKLSKIINVQAVDTTGNNNLFVIKNIFSPDNDGIDDSLFIQYNFLKPKGTLNIVIYDINGRKVRNLFNEKIYDKTGIISWDGKKDNGQLAPIGVYIVCLIYKTTENTAVRKTSAILARRLN